MKFNIGDRVKIVHNHLHDYDGKIGTVKGINDYIKWWTAIEFDNIIKGGHNCGGKCKNEYGRYILDELLELVEPLIIDEYEEWEY